MKENPFCYFKTFSLERMDLRTWIDADRIRIDTDRTQIDADRTRTDADRTWIGDWDTNSCDAKASVITCSSTCVLNHACVWGRGGV